MFVIFSAMSGFFPWLDERVDLLVSFSLLSINAGHHSSACRSAPLTLGDCVSVKLQHYTAGVCMYVCTRGWLLYNKVKAGNFKACIHP